MDNMTQEEIQLQIDELNNYIEFLNSNAEEFIQSNVEELSNIIDKLPNRTPLKEGHITAKQNLINKKQLYLDAPNDMIQKEIEEIKRQVEQLEVLLDE